MWFSPKFVEVGWTNYGSPTLSVIKRTGQPVVRKKSKMSPLNHRTAGKIWA
jgi:hypothetical protein